MVGRTVGLTVRSRPASSVRSLRPSAAPITFNFISELPLGTPYETGSFTKLDIFTNDSSWFELGTTSTTSGFSFIVGSPDGLRYFIGGVVDADNIGGLSISASSGGGGAVSRNR